MKPSYEMRHRTVVPLNELLDWIDFLVGLEPIYRRWLNQALAA